MDCQYNQKGTYKTRKITKLRSPPALTKCSHPTSSICTNKNNSSRETKQYA